MTKIGLLFSLVLSASLSVAQIAPQNPLSINFGIYRGNVGVSPVISLLPADTSKVISVVVRPAVGSGLTNPQPSLIRSGLSLTLRFATSDNLPELSQYEITIGGQKRFSGAITTNRQQVTTVPAVPGAELSRIYSQIGKVDAKYDSLKRGVVTVTVIDSLASATNAAIAGKVPTSTYLVDKQNTAMSLAGKAPKADVDAANQAIANTNLNVGLKANQLDLNATNAAVAGKLGVSDTIALLRKTVYVADKAGIQQSITVKADTAVVGPAVRQIAKKLNTADTTALLRKTTYALEKAGIQQSIGTKADTATLGATARQVAGKLNTGDTTSLVRKQVYATDKAVLNQTVATKADSAVVGPALRARLQYATSSGIFSTATADVVQFDNASWERKAGTVTTSTPGYGGVFFPGPTGYYYARRFWGDVDIRMFGAISGDGIDDAPAIQAAINYIPNTVANRGGSIFIPGGFWDVFTKLTLPVNVRVSIRGIGVRLYNESGGSGSCLVWRGASGGTMMEYDGGAATRHNGPMIWGVNFWSSDLTSTMLRLKYVTHWSVKECGFGQGGTGIETDAGVGVATGNDNAWSVIDNNTFIGCANYGTKVTNGTYGFTFSNGDCQVAATAIGLYLDKYSQNVRVIGAKFDRGNPAIYNAGGNNSFVGIHVENTALGMQIVRDASITFSGKGNYVQGTFNNTLGGGTGVGLQLGSGTVNTNISIVGTSLTTTLQDLGADQYEGYINGFHRYQNKLSSNIIFELLVGTITSGQFYASGNGPIIAGASGAPNVILRPNTGGGLQVQNTAGTLITNFNADGSAVHRGVLRSQFATGSAAPTGADISPGYFLLYKNATGDSTQLYLNDGGTIKTPFVSAATYAANRLADRTAATSASSLTTGTLSDARLNNVGTAGTLGGSGQIIESVTRDAKGRVTGITTIATPTGGSGTSSSLTSLTVTTLTRDAIQTAVNSVTANAIINLIDGTYSGFDTNPVFIAGKTNLTLQGTKQTNFTGTNASSFILANGDFDGVKIDGINFRNTATTGGGNGQILVNEQGTAAGKKNLRITNCKFRAPNFRINAITFSLYSALTDNGNGTGYPLTGFVAEDIDIDSMGRCGLELVAHNWNDGKTQVMMNNYHINRAKIKHTGRVAETNGVINGMAVSVSGYARNINTTNCYVEDARLLGIEYAGVTDGTIKANTLTNPGSVTYVGISLSDNSHNFNRNDIIDGNYVNTKNKCMSINQGYGHVATNNTFIQQVATTDGGSVYLQDSNYIMIYGGVINGNSYNPIRIDNSSYCRIGGRMTITNDASQYALVSIYGNASPATGSVGNVVETAITFIKQGTVATSGVVETIGNTPNTTGVR